MNSNSYKYQVYQFWSLPVFAAGAGFLDSAYLTYSRLTGNAPDCGSGSGCAEITLGPLGAAFGIPVAIFGLIFYTAMVLGLVLGFPRKWLVGGSITGVAATLALQGIAAMHHTFCIWCAFSAVCAFILCVGTLYSGPIKVNGRSFAVSLALAGLVYGAFGFTISQISNRENAVNLNGITWNDLAPTSLRHLGGNSPLPALAMFADFTCPKCKSQFKSVETLSRQSRLRFVIRHWPHFTSRPSYDAAIALESVGNDAAYWNSAATLMFNWFEDHDQLEALLERSHIGGLPTAAAGLRVAADVRLAKLLELHHTPLYLLCDKDGIHQIDSGDIEVTIKSYVK